jgi:L-arginine dehydrogenase
MRTIVLIVSIRVILADDLPPLPENDVRTAVRAAFEQLAHGKAVQPPQVVTDLPGEGDVIAYQAVLADAETYAVKVSPYLPQPDGRAIVTAWTLLVSTRTGEPLLLVDAGPLTAERTAATTALAVDLLAPADASRLAVVGLGPIGRAHLRHVRTVRDFRDITVFAPRMPDGLEGVHVAASADEAAQDADVVLLCTSAAKPVIDVRRLRPGTLVTSVSTNAPMAHEIEPAALLDLDVYADLTSAAFAAGGEMRIAAAEHGFTVDHIRGDLAGLVAGRAPQPSGERPVFFRSVGLGIEDAAIARAVLTITEEQS